MKNWFRWTLYPVLFLFLFWAVLTGFVAPRIETWLKNNVERLSADSTPVIISFDDIQIDFSTASIIVEGIKIRPKQELADIITPIFVRSLHVSIDTFQLLTQRFQVRAVFINEPSAVIELDPLNQGSSKPERLPIRKILDTINSIPVSRVYLIQPDVTLHSAKQDFDVHISGNMLSVKQEKNLITTKISLEKISGHFKKSELETGIRAMAQLTPEKLEILHSEVSAMGATVKAKGEIDKVEDLLIGPPIHYSIYAKATLDKVYQELHDRFGIKMPALSGTVESQIMGDWDKEKGIKAKLDLNTDQVKVGDFEVGQAQLSGEADNDRLFLNEVQLIHNAGKVRLQQSSLQLHKPFQFNGTVNIEEANLEKIFDTLQLKEIPVMADAVGRLPCAGTLSPIEVTCYGDITGKDIWVGTKYHDPKSTLVAINQTIAKGRVKINEEEIQFDTQLNIANDWGHSSGTINFTKGFSINFDTKELDLKNIKNLLNLKWGGKIAIDGNTTGDSHAATLSAKATSKEFSLEEYYFDQLQTKIGYEKGILALSEAEFNTNGLRAYGGLNLDFTQKGSTQIHGELKIPQLFIPGVRTLVEKKLPLPNRMEGHGSGAVKFDGPLDLWKMNLDFTGEASQVAVGPESLGTMQAHIVSTNGNMEFKDVNFTRNNSRITVKGEISNKPQYNLHIQGNQWRLEEMEALSKVGLSLLGSVNFTGEVSGPLEKPLLQARGNVSETVLSDQEVPNSFFTLQSDKEHFQMNANIFGNKIQTDLDLPLVPHRPLRLRAKTQDWNFAQLLAVLSGNLQASEFDSRLTMDMDFKSERGDLSDLDGTLKAQSFMLRRSQTMLQNMQPVVVETRNGAIDIKSFALQGPNKASLKLEGSNFRVDDLNLQMRANFDLRILHLFLPFLDDLGGPFDISAQLKGSPGHPKLLGSASITDAFFKIRNFPHVFENLTADITFSQNNILIEDINGNLAGGTLEGDGQVQINGSKNIPVNLQVHLENPQLNVPDKVHTTGVADLTITGTYFPYTLGGKYMVKGGLFEMELSNNLSSASSPKQSQFLPKVIKEAHFEPLNFNLDVDFTNSIQVKNSLIDGYASGALNVQGTPQSPIMLGKVDIRKDSKIIFKDKVFEVQNGTLNFNSTDEVNPDVYLTATSRVNDYDITLLAQGPAKALNFRLSSLPPLPEPEIVTLLALGLTSSQLEKNISAKDQGQQTANEVFGAVVSQTFGRGIQDALGVTLQVTNSFDTVKNVNTPKLTATKQLGARTSVQVSHPISGSQSNDVKLQYRLSRNVSLVGSIEQKSSSDENTTTANTTASPQQENINIFGLDLEFRKEFK